MTSVFGATRMTRPSVSLYLAGSLGLFTGFLRATTTKNKSQYLNAYQDSADLIFANVPLAKANHMIKPRINVGRDYSRV